jgi:hypothetical protein
VRAHRAGAPGRLRVELTAAWLGSVVPKVHAVLARTLPALCAHPLASVRAAVGRCAGELLRDCRATLAPSGQVRCELEAWGGACGS